MNAHNCTQGQLPQGSLILGGVGGLNRMRCPRSGMFSLFDRRSRSRTKWSSLGGTKHGLRMRGCLCQMLDCYEEESQLVEKCSYSSRT